MRLKIFLLLSVICLGFLLFPNQLRATSDKYELPEGETKQGVQLITQPRAEIEGRIVGDVFIVNQTTIISGVIEGNLFFVGKTINLNKTSEITGSAFILADTANLKGTIRGNSYVATNRLYTSASFKNKGEFNFLAQEAELRGAYHRKMRGRASQIQLKGAALFKDANLRTKYLNYDAKTICRGKLTYYAPYQALGENAKLSSCLKWNKTHLPSFWQKFGLHLTQRVFSVIYLLIFGFLWLWLWREKYKTVVLVLREKLAPALGWGALALFILPSVFAVLVLTLVGIPLAIALLGVFVFWAYLSPIVVGGLVGDYLLQLFGYDAEKYPYLALFLGVVVLSVLFALPGAGWIFRLFVIILALGAVVVGRKEIIGLKF